METRDLCRERIKSVNWLFFISLILYVLGSIAVGTFHMGLEANIITSQLLILVPAIIWILCNKIPVKSYLRLKKMDGTTVFLVVLFAILMHPLLTFINAVSMLFLEYNISEELSDSSGDMSFVVMFLLIAVMPAFFEELVYRGVYFHTYRKHSFAKGALLSGFLFGLMHANFNQFFYAFALGVIFAFLIEATGSLFSTMLVHMCYNGFSVLVLYGVQYLSKHSKEFAEVYDKAEENAGVMKFSDIAVLIPHTVVCTILGFVVFRAIARHNNRYENVIQIGLKKENRGSFKRLISIPLILGMLGLIFLMVVNELLTMGIIK